MHIPARWGSFSFAKLVDITYSSSGKQNIGKIVIFHGIYSRFIDSEVGANNSKNLWLMILTYKYNGVYKPTILTGGAHLAAIENIHTEY